MYRYRHKKFFLRHQACRTITIFQRKHKYWLKAKLTYLCQRQQFIYRKYKNWSKNIIIKIIVRNVHKLLILSNLCNPMSYVCLIDFLFKKKKTFLNVLARMFVNLLTTFFLFLQHILLFVCCYEFKNIVYYN